MNFKEFLGEISTNVSLTFHANAQCFKVDSTNFSGQIFEIVRQA